MLKKVLLMLTALNLIVLPIRADLSLLQTRLERIVAPPGERVGVALIDLKAGYQFTFNGSQEFPAASVAKVPVMTAAFHLANTGQLDLERKVWFSESDKLGGSGVLQWMRGGRTYSLRSLIRMMIVLSDNTATKLVVDTLGTPEIAGYLKKAGLTQTQVVDPTMLREPPALCTNRTTPLDMAHLLVQVYSCEGFSTDAKREMLSHLKNQRYRWGIWRGVAPGTVVADKTGNLEDILNDAGIVYTKSGNYILS